ncbi:MAG: DEAD/DEAH box helicase [Deltaproteobacteria bacterium]|nr:DEAD/DEAH box helicase [Deltaproteobacteria bacterium]
MLTFFRRTINRLFRPVKHSGHVPSAVVPQEAEGAEVEGKTRTSADSVPQRKRLGRRKRRNSQSHLQDTNQRAPLKKSAKSCPLVLPSLKEVAPVEGKTRFADLDIATEVLCGIQDLEFQYCTPIQAECLRHALGGKDVTGKAQTGTGKTAAFLTAALTHLIRHPKSRRTPGSCRVLVLAPTRELAIQIHKDAEALGKYCGFNHLAVFGGMGYQQQREALNKPIDILVGTPGRIIDYSTSGSLRLSEAEILVIDEADRMLDMGFIPDVRRIVNKLPPAGKRQTMFFSATLTGEIVRLQDRWLVDPVRIETEPEAVVTDLIDQKFYSVSCDDKLALLLWILNNDDVGRMLVFCNRKDSTQRLALSLQRHGIRSELLSGDIPQQKRLRILENFRAGKTPVVVATDVAARGIHVEAISHVILYDLPDDPEDYVHRVGRTGRAGETGKSISFACEYGGYMIPDLEQFLDGKIACINPTEEMLSLPPLPPEALKTGKKAVSFSPRPRSRNRQRTPQKSPRFPRVDVVKAISLPQEVS